MNRLWNFKTHKDYYMKLTTLHSVLMSALLAALCMSAPVCRAASPVAPAGSTKAAALTDKQIENIVDLHRPLLGGKIPADIKQRLGVTHMGGKYFLTEEPYIIEGSRKIRELGFTTAKYFLSLPDKQGGINGYLYNSDWRLAPKASYVDVLSHPYFIEAFDCGQECIVLNVGGLGKLRNSPSPDFTQTYDDMFSICKYLLEKYRDRPVSFILKNWEGDWMMRGLGTKRAEWMAVPAERRELIVRNMTAWFATRQKAVTDARNAVPKTKAKVFYAIEANQVTESMGGATGIASDVLPAMEVDMVSWSCYEGLRDVKKLYRGFEYLRTQMRPTPYMNGERRVMIGEVGFHEARIPNTVELWDKFFGVCFALDVPLIIDWELYCNEPIDKDTKKNTDGRVYAAEELRGMWLLRPDGSKSETCHYWQKLLANPGRSIVK